MPVRSTNCNWNRNTWHGTTGSQIAMQIAHGYFARTTVRARRSHGFIVCYRRTLNYTLTQNDQHRQSASQKRRMVLAARLLATQHHLKTDVALMCTIFNRSTQCGGSSPHAGQHMQPPPRTSKHEVHGLVSERATATHTEYAHCTDGFTLDERP